MDKACAATELEVLNSNSNWLLNIAKNKILWFTVYVHLHMYEVCMNYNLKYVGT